MQETDEDVGFTAALTDRPENTRSTHRLLCLQQLSLILIKSLTVEQVMDAILSEGLSALNVVTGAICLLTSDGAHLEAMRTFGLPPNIARQYDRLPLESPVPLADAVRQGKLILVNSAVHDTRDPHRAVVGTADSEQVMIVAIPLKVQDRVLGAISITFTDRGPLSAADRAFVETIAQMFALALERARQYEVERCAREIAEKRLEQELRESNARASDFFGSLTEGFIAYNQEWRVTYVNEVASASVRLPREALMGKVIWDIFPEVVDSAYYAACHQAMNERVPVHRDDFWPRYNVWLESHIFPIHDGIAVMFRDITETRRAEESLRSAETQLRLVTDASPVLITYIDVQEHFRFVNRAYADWFGMPTEQIVGKPVREVIHPEAYEAISGYIDEALAGQTVTYERTVVDGAGKVRHIYATYVPDLSATGAVRGFIGVVTDITERKQLEMRLREESESLETINRLGQRLSAELNLEKLVQDATDGATKLTGAQFGAFFYNVVNPGEESYMLYTISGVPREKFSRFPMPRNTAVFAPTFAGEGAVRLDDVTRDPRYGKNAPYHGKPSGHLPVVSYLAVPVVSRSGEVLGGLFFGHEQPGIFTERHERIVEGLASQAAIAIDNARLFQAERERSDQLSLAISEVHHRVKNSLQAVAALLEMQIPDDESVMPVEAARDSLSQIKTIALVHDLLAHDKPIGMVDAAKVLTNLARLLSEGMRTDNQPLSIRVDAEPVEMPTKSATSLALVVNELLTNAAKHNAGLNESAAADQGAIEVSLTCEDETITVVVRDHGPGFSPDFDPVKHAHIGLQLVQTLVRHDLRGSISFGNASSEDGVRIGGAKIGINFPTGSLTE